MRLIFDIVGQTFRALWAHKLRSFLTMFGIAWGVGSLLVLVGLGEGFRSGQHKQLATFGNDLVMMWNVHDWACALAAAPMSAASVSTDIESTRFKTIVLSR